MRGRLRERLLRRLAALPGEDRHFHRALLVMLLTVSLIALVSLVGALTIFANPEASAIASVSLLGSCLAAFLLLLRGFPRMAGVILVTATWILAFCLVLFSGGVRILDMVYLIASSVAVGVLFGPRAGLAVVLLSAVAGLALLLLERSGRLPEIVFPIPPPAALVNFLMASAIAMAVLSVTERSKRTALAQAHAELAERRAAEERLRQSLAEKEVLLGELYHRTRNNMQLIVSFLRLEAARFADPRVLSSFSGLQGRIRAIALVHEGLAAGHDSSHVDLLDYARELVRFVTSGANEVIGRVSLVVEGEPRPLLVDTAIPCGLILHELLDNALRHAFPDGRSGRVLVRISGGTIGEAVLEVSDDGVGMGEAEHAMGLLLVRSLAEEQLSGSWELRSGPGVTCRVRLRTDQFTARV